MMQNYGGAFEKRLYSAPNTWGSCLIVGGTTVTSTVLAAIESSNFVCNCYNVNPPNLQNRCDGRLQTFSLHDTPSCIIRGLAIAWHNEIRNNIIHLSIQAFSPDCVFGEPLIHEGHSRPEGGGCVTAGKFQKHGVRVNMRPMGDTDRRHHWQHVWRC